MSKTHTVHFTAAVSIEADSPEEALEFFWHWAMEAGDTFRILHAENQDQDA